MVMTLKNTIDRLRDKGVVLTPQRLAIVQFLQDNKTHPTADEIYNGL